MNVSQLYLLILSEAKDFFQKVFYSKLPEIEDFDYQNLNCWIKLINQFPRIPFIFIFECILSCYFIRLFVRIKKPIFSLLLTIFVASMTENLSSLFKNRKLAIFENYLLLPFILFFWILYNFFPFDLVFKLSKLMSLLFYVLNGFVVGQNITLGIDEAIYMFPKSTFPVLLTGIFYGAAKNIIIYIFARVTNQKTRSAGPVIFGCSLGALIYYYLTDLGHISDSMWFDKEQMRLIVIITMSVLGIFHFLIPDWLFTECYNGFGKFVDFFIPYYGSTWIPTRPESTPKPPSVSQNA